LTVDLAGAANQFRVELCGGKRGSEPTSQICYIGDPTPKVSTRRCCWVPRRSQLPMHIRAHDFVVSSQHPL